MPTDFDNEHQEPYTSYRGSPTRRSKWTQGSGEKTCAANMTVPHLRNAILWLYRQPVCMPHVTGGGFNDVEDFDVEVVDWIKDDFTRDEWVKAFQDELLRRDLQAQREARELEEALKKQRPKNPDSGKVLNEAHRLYGSLTNATETVQRYIKEHPTYRDENATTQEIGRLVRDAFYAGVEAGEIVWRPTNANNPHTYFGTSPPHTIHPSVDSRSRGTNDCTSSIQPRTPAKGSNVRKRKPSRKPKGNKSVAQKPRRKKARRKMAGNRKRVDRRLRDLSPNRDRPRRRNG